jgi:hypothetical protein
MGYSRAKAVLTIGNTATKGSIAGNRSSHPGPSPQPARGHVPFEPPTRPMARSPPEAGQTSAAGALAAPPNRLAVRRVKAGERIVRQLALAPGRALGRV